VAQRGGPRPGGGETKLSESRNASVSAGIASRAARPISASACAARRRFSGSDGRLVLPAALRLAKHAHQRDRVQVADDAVGLDRIIGHFLTGLQRVGLSGSFSALGPKISIPS
jgi:hypothetical protein